MSIALPTIVSSLTLGLAVTTDVDGTRGLVLPVAFEENAGQFAPEVRFVARTAGLRAEVTDEGFVVRSGAARFAFQFGRADCVVGIDELRGVAHHLRAGAGQEIRNVPLFAGLRFDEVAPGIDVVLYARGGALEYDIELESGADLDGLLVRVRGAEALALDSAGGLVIALGADVLRQSAPRCYELRADGSRLEREGGFRLVGEDAFAFEVPGRDPANSLVIDPVLLSNTYVGGNHADEAHDVALDATGAIYVTGWSKSGDFPVTPDALDSRRDGREVVVFKLDPSASELLWATYIGGDGDDVGHGIALAPSGEIFVVGETESDDFPATPLSLDSNSNGMSDAFALALRPDGAALAWCTFLGGKADDVAEDVAIGLDGSVFLVGTTRSSNFPTSYRALQRERRGGRDAFVTRLDSNGDVAIFSTFLGGLRDDFAHAIALDAEGHAHVAGRTQSSDYPTTSATFDSTKNDDDAFVSKLGVDGAALVFSTLLGGSGTDEAHALAVGLDGRVFVAGTTGSLDFPTTVGAAFSLDRPHRDGFVAALSDGGAALSFGTYFGGSGNDEIHDLALDERGLVWLVGRTQSDDLPTGSSAEAARRLGSADAFAVAFESSDGALHYASSFGGPGDDVAYAVCAEPTTGAIAVVGASLAVPPAQRGALGGSDRGTSDVFVTRFAAGRCGTKASATEIGLPCGATLASTTPRLGRPLTLTLTSSSPLAFGYVLYAPRASTPTPLSEICSAYLDFSQVAVLSTFTTAIDGTHAFSTEVPDAPELCGLSLVIQGAVINPPSGPLPFGSATQAIELLFGD